MIEVRGKYNKAKIFTDVVDSTSLLRYWNYVIKNLRREAASNDA